MLNWPTFYRYTNLSSSGKTLCTALPEEHFCGQTLMLCEMAWLGLGFNYTVSHRCSVRLK